MPEDEYSCEYHCYLWPADAGSIDLTAEGIVCRWCGSPATLTIRSRPSSPDAPFYDAPGPYTAQDASEAG